MCADSKKCGDCGRWVELANKRHPCDVKRRRLDKQKSRAGQSRLAAPVTKTFYEQEAAEPTDTEAPEQSHLGLGLGLGFAFGSESEQGPPTAPLSTFSLPTEPEPEAELVDAADADGRAGSAVVAEAEAEAVVAAAGQLSPGEQDIADYQADLQKLLAQQKEAHAQAKQNLGILKKVVGQAVQKVAITEQAVQTAQQCQREEGRGQQEQVAREQRLAHQREVFDDLGSHEARFRVAQLAERAGETLIPVPVQYRNIELWSALI